MNRIGIITNPLSRQNRRGLADVRAIVRQNPAAIHVEIDSIGQIPQVLSDFASDGVDLIGISGGDGTVQAVITALLNGGAYEHLPSLSVLAAGMTNVIAANVGLQGRPDRALARLLRADFSAGSPGRSRRHNLVSLRRAPGEAEIHGMFLGTAAFYRTAMLAHSEVHPWGFQRDLAVAVSMAMAILRLLYRRGRADGPWQGDKIGIAIDDLASTEGDCLLFLATTLEQLVLGLMPFWGGGEGPLRHTSVDFPPGHLARALWPLARGRPRPWFPAAGYHSGRARECRLTLSCPIIFDGEIITPDPAIPVVIRADRRITFWQDR